MTEKLTAWQLFDQVLRTFFLSIWRLALLVVATVIAHAALWGFYLQDVPFAQGYTTSNLAVHLALTALVLSPLTVAVMRRVILGKTYVHDWWQPSVWRIAGLIFLALIGLHLLEGYVVNPLIYFSMTGDGGWISQTAWTLQGWSYVALLVAVGARFVWIVPALAVGRTKSVKVAFREIRGNYRLALAVCLLAILPIYIFEYYFGIGPAGREQGIYPMRFGWVWWISFLEHSAILTGWCILLASLSAELYRVEFGRRGVTAP